MRSYLCPQKPRKGCAHTVNIRSPVVNAQSEV